jgi:hypothetical protein
MEHALPSGNYTVPSYYKKEVHICRSTASLFLCCQHKRYTYNMNKKDVLSVGKEKNEMNGHYTNRTYIFPKTP